MTYIFINYLTNLFQSHGLVAADAQLATITTVGLVLFMLMGSLIIADKVVDEINHNTNIDDQTI